MNSNWLWFGAFILAIVALITYLSNQFPAAMAEDGSGARIVYLMCLLAVVASSFFFGNRIAFSDVIKQALAWIAIFAVLVIGYTYKDDFIAMSDRVSGEVAPSRAAQDTPGTVTLHRQMGGHFGVDANVNKTRINFVVDTGASDVVLTYRDAERAGLEPWNLTFDRAYQTANGVAYGAKVDIQTITIGDITLHNVQGSVMKDGLQTSLLGMTYLNRLRTYNVSGNKMTLTH